VQKKISFQKLYKKSQNHIT